MADPFTYSVELNFPEVIEGILSFSLSYDKLQSVLHFIIEALKRHENGLKFLMDKDQAMINFNTTILNLKAKQDDLEAKLNSAENKFEEKLNKQQNDLENKLKEALDGINKQLKEPAVETKALVNKIENQEKAIQNQDKYLKGINNDVRDIENQAENLAKRVKELERDIDDLFGNLGNGQNKSEGGKGSVSAQNYPIKKNQNPKNNRGNQKGNKQHQDISTKGRNLNENPYADARGAAQDSDRISGNKSNDPSQDLNRKGEFLPENNQGRKKLEDEDNLGENAQSGLSKGNLPRANIDSQYPNSENAPYYAQNASSDPHGYPDTELLSENGRPQQRINLRQSENPEGITFEDLPQGTDKKQYAGQKNREEPEDESYEEKGSRQPRRKARELSKNSEEGDTGNNRNIRFYKGKGEGDSSREIADPEDGLLHGETKRKGRRNQGEESEGEKDMKKPARGQEDPEVASSKEIKYVKKNPKKNPEKENRNIYSSTGISDEVTDENPESQESLPIYRGKQGKNTNKPEIDKNKDEGINISQEGSEPSYKRNTKNPNKGFRRDADLNREGLDRDEDNLYRNQSENIPSERQSLRNISERPSGRQNAYRNQQENPYTGHEEDSYGDQENPSEFENHSRPSKNQGRKYNREGENYQEDPEDGSSYSRNTENERRQNRPYKRAVYSGEENPADENSQSQRNKDPRSQAVGPSPDRQGNSDQNQGEFTNNYRPDNRSQRNPDEFVGDNPQDFVRNYKKNARDLENPEGEEFSDRNIRNQADLQGEMLRKSRRDQAYPEDESERKSRRDQENPEDLSSGARGLRKGQDSTEEDASQGRPRKYGRSEDNPEEFSGEPSRNYRRGQEYPEDYSGAAKYGRGQENPENFSEEPAKNYRRGQDNPENFSGEPARNYKVGQDSPEDYSGEPARNYRRGQDNPEDYSGEPARRHRRGQENLEGDFSQENPQNYQEDPQEEFSHSGNAKKPRRPNKEVTFKRDQDSQENSGDLNAETERGYGNPNQRGSRTERMARQARNPEENLHLSIKNPSQDPNDRKYGQSQGNEEDLSEGEAENTERNKKNYKNPQENYEGNEDLSGEEGHRETGRRNADYNRRNQDKNSQKYTNPDYQGSQTDRGNEEYGEASETDRKYPEDIRRPLKLKLKGQEDGKKQQGDLSDQEGASYEGINEGSSLEKAAYPNRKNQGSTALKNIAKGPEANKKSNLKSLEENKRDLSSKKDSRDTSDKNRENAYQAGKNSAKNTAQGNRGNNIPKYQGARTERMIGDNSPSPRHRARQAKYADETPYFNTKNISGDSEEKYDLEEDEEGVEGVEGAGKDNRKFNKNIKNLNEKDSDRRTAYNKNQPDSYNRQGGNKNREESQGKSNAKKKENSSNAGNYRKKNEGEADRSQRENARDYSQDRSQYKGDNRQNSQDRSQYKGDNRQNSQIRNLSQGISEDQEYSHENSQQNKNQTSPITVIPNPATTIIYNKNTNAPQIDVNAIKNLERKVGDIDLILSNFSHLSPEAIEEILIKLRRLEQKLNQKIDKTEIDDLAKKLEELSNEFGSINILFQKYESKDAAPEPPQKTKTTDTSALNALNRKLLILEETVKRFQLPTGVDLFQLWNDIKKIWDAIKDLQNLLQKISTNMQEKLDNLEKKVDKKIDENALKALEEKFFKALQEAIDNLMGKFADKNDTRKALKYIETIIRSQKQDEVIEKREGEDAMFARKPLGGWSCASCEKALENLTGKIGPFHPWNKLPLRDAADRIARVGPGFSRMLSTLPNEGAKTLRLDHVRSISPLGYATEYEAITPEPVILPKLSDRSATPGPR
ncbi:unnamed protein product [Blepharisma stoltei]|uniref:Uncharacterized protein n=1 Tax=Blepharisma stoltei TaxID=1481888 RepID=A0AAU9IF00_9CILI|nr:unnamed protein product [Blepharisma stoltei]